MNALWPAEVDMTAAANAIVDDAKLFVLIVYATGLDSTCIRSYADFQNYRRGFAMPGRCLQQRTSKDQQ